MPKAGHMITLPFPPSINGYWRSIVRGNGKKMFVAQILSQRARDFRSQAMLAARLSGLTGLKLEGKLRVEVDLHCPTKREYDVDNFNKAILDALTHAEVWRDDVQVYDIHTKKMPSQKGGMSVVRIWQIND